MTKPILRFYCEHAPTREITKRAGLEFTLAMRQELRRHIECNLGQLTESHLPEPVEQDKFGGLPLKAHGGGTLRCRLCGGAMRVVVLGKSGTIYLEAGR